MAGFSSQQANQPITGINVTPLVDIVLVLLVIFMVTAKLVVSRALPVDLPQASSDGEAPSMLTVTLDASGRASLDGAPVANKQQLLDAAERALKDKKNLRALIHADGQVAHRRVMGILDTLREAGIEHVGFSVEHASSAEPEEWP